MALRIWPDALPNGYARYTLSPQDESIRTPMEIGADRVRRVSLDRHDDLQVGWRFTNAEMELFRAWHADDPRSDLGDSEDLTTWTNVGSTDSTMAAAGPDGDQATRIVETVGGTFHYLSRGLGSANTPANGTYVIHATLKAAGRDFARVDLLNEAGATLGAHVNLSNGAVGGLGAGVTATTKSRGNGWWRLSLEVPIGSGATVPAVRIFTATSLTTYSYSGDGASGVDVCEVMGRARTGWDLPAKTQGRGECLGAGYGAEWFKVRVSRGGNVELVDARFTGPFKVTALPGMNWDVTASLEIADEA